MSEKSSFEDLYSLDLSSVLDKKIGKYTYLSWPWCMAEMTKRDPGFEWNTVFYHGEPFLKTECGYFVSVETIYKGKKKTQLHPVLDNSNKPIEKPNAFQINTSIQRAFVKCCAQHGLGLYVYAGEDLPQKDEDAINEEYEKYAKTSLVVLTEAVKKGTKALEKALVDLPKSEYKAKFWQNERDALKLKAEEFDNAAAK